MTSATPMFDANGDPFWLCERHPETETALRCGRCETPICPKCMIHTPGGIRCPECAKLRRPPMYEHSRMDYAKAIGVALVLAPALGLAGAFLIPTRGIGGFFLLIGLFVGSAVGGMVAEAIRRATRGKLGTGMQVVAVLTIVVAAVLRVIFAGAPIETVVTNMMSLVIVGVGAFAAWGRLR